MTTLAYTVPTPGSDLNAIADPELASALNTIKTWANGQIDGTNVAATLTGRRLVGVGYIPFSSGTTAQTLMAAPDGNLQLQSGNNAAMPAWAFLDPANFAITGKTNTQLILRMSIASNATAPAANFAAALYPATFGGAVSGTIATTLGSAVSGSSLAINAPGASAATVAETAAFAFPAAAAYVMAVASSATIAAGGYTSVVLQLFALNS